MARLTIILFLALLGTIPVATLAPLYAQNTPAVVPGAIGPSFLGHWHWGGAKGPDRDSKVYSVDIHAQSVDTDGNVAGQISLGNDSAGPRTCGREEPDKGYALISCKIVGGQLVIRWETGLSKGSRFVLGPSGKEWVE